MASVPLPGTPELARATSAKLEQALLLHRQGQLTPAEALYREILASQAEHFDALQLLASIEVRRHHCADALLLFDRALALHPDHAGVHNNRGIALLALGRPQQALHSYERALRIEPGLADAHNNRGNVLLELGRAHEALQSYDLAVQLQPCRADHHNNRGLALAALKRLDEALRSHAMALQLDPGHADAHYNCGNVLHALQRLAPALESYASALKIRPGHADAHNNCGTVLRKLKRPLDALASFDQAILFKPVHADAHYNRGNALRELKRFAAALDSYDQALLLKPEHADAHSNRGLTLMAMQRPLDALASHEQALLLTPRNAEVHNNRGDALLELKRPAAALFSYERALELNPDHAEAHNSRGTALLGLKQPALALQSYDRTLRLKPEHAQAHNNRGVALLDLKRAQEALISLEHALRLTPDYAQAHNNRGIALNDLSRPQEALASYDQALLLKPDAPEVHNNRANALRDMQRFAEALLSYSQAVLFKPDNANARWNASLCHLSLGDFAQGWPEYEWRWKMENGFSPARVFTQALWLGKEAIEGKTILLYREQGLGDTIQFCRYARKVAELGATVILEVQAPLKALLRGLDGVTVLLAQGEPLPDFDVRCPLLSLPLAFQTRLETISDAAYLHSDAGKCRAWRAKLPQHRRNKVGLAWSGNVDHKNDANRSIRLASLQRALHMTHNGQLDYYCLQKELREADLRMLAQAPPIRFFGDALDDFSDTAALIDLMDLLITVDTSVAHLAGALGKPVWILLPWNADWRWLQERADSPWYRSARLFRQPAQGDWASVLEHVAIELTMQFPPR